MKFTIEKKMVVKVRYYENLWFICDESGETIFAGRDEARAREVLTILNAYHNKKEYRRGKATPAPKKNRRATKRR